jgi:hypothetical protein
MKTTLLTAIVALSLGLHGGATLAHHGWSWTTGDNMELTGIIKKVRLGNPYGILEVEVNGEMWTGEVGQPWPMGDSHRHLMITDEEWLAFMDDLQQTLDKFEVPQSEQDEIKMIVESTREAIVVAPLRERPLKA